jgi:pimeloyl-ACP methyl ester carboxylesterase
VWPSLIALSALIRKLMVQYVGDVAIYVSANKLDRFDKIRKEIKETARVSASAIYEALADGGRAFEYGKVAVVGHSLGSVIAYDTLNRLINDDMLAGNRVRVADRTCVFETFGSPLDKIAFFFTIQGKDTLRIREQLASTVQPLIQSYSAYRRFPWINVYSPNDIISGKLDLYDLPPGSVPAGAKTVENVIDEDAAVPLVAHVDYWKNAKIWQRLYAEVTRSTPTTTLAPAAPTTPAK